MSLFVVGVNSASTNALNSFAEERGEDIKYSGEINTLNRMKKAIDEGITYNTIILCVLAYNIDTDDFNEGINYLCDKDYTGTVIVYAPSGTYDDERIRICIDYGLDNILKDVISSRMKQNLNRLVPLTERPLPSMHSEENASIQSTSNVQINQDSTVDSDYENHSSAMAEQTQPQAFSIEPQPLKNVPEAIHKQEDTHKVLLTPEIVVAKKIGVIGVIPRIGVTTQAIMILNALKEAEKSCCYIQYNNSSFLNDMENYFADITKSQNKGCLIYEGIDYYKNPNLVHSQSYDYHVKDYGSCVNSEFPPEFFSNDIRIIVCGGTAEEVSRLTALRTQLVLDKNLIYVFSFIADYEKDDIKDLMGDRPNTVLFAPYTPDCYKLSEDSKKIYFPILGFELEPEQKKKKNPLGFLSRRKK